MCAHTQSSSSSRTACWPDAHMHACDSNACICQMCASLTLQCSAVCATTFLHTFPPNTPGSPCMPSPFPPLGLPTTPQPPTALQAQAACLPGCPSSQGGGSEGPARQRLAPSTCCPAGAAATTAWHGAPPVLHRQTGISPHINTRHGPCACGYAWQAAQQAGCAAHSSPCVVTRCCCCGDGQAHTRLIYACW